MAFFQCRYGASGGVRTHCEREAMPNWTTCRSHYSAGMNRKTWERQANELKKRELRDAWPTENGRNVGL